MSGRTRVVLPDGRFVVGYRKTLRRNPPRKPVVERVSRTRYSADRPNILSGPPSPDYPVRLTFLLPDTVMVSPGPHGFNTMVLPGNVVRIRGGNAEHCFSLARCFFAAVAMQRPGFTCHAVLARDDDERRYGRHLTVVRGALVISGGLTQPRVFEGA